MSNNIPYSKHSYGPNDIHNVLDVLNKGWIARGPLVANFEHLLSQKYGFKHAIACSSGSSALDIVLRSLDLSASDEVIVPSITWAATASSVLLAGANVVFADIDLDTICVTAESIAEKITLNTKAIIVVHFAGRPCNMQPIWELAQQHSLHVIEDSAHAFGSSYETGEPISTSPYTYASTFSFHPAKNITTAEGGLVTTQHSELLENFRTLRSGGVLRSSNSPFQKANYQVSAISSNYHLSELHAALGLGQLDVVDKFIAHRRSLALCYSQALSNAVGLTVPPPSLSSSWNLYVVRLSDPSKREQLFNHLNLNGIGAYFHYPCLHRFTDTYKQQLAHLPSSELYADTAITLPIGPHLSYNEVDYIATTIIDFLTDN